MSPITESCYAFDGSCRGLLSTREAAVVFCTLGGVVAVFQLALAGGLPWGGIALAGKFPGQLPLAMRIVAFVQAVVMGSLAAVVCTRAGIVFPHWLLLSEKLCWAVVVFSALSLLMNLVTPIRWERLIWAPVAAALFASSFVVAIS